MRFIVCHRTAMLGALGACLPAVLAAGPDSPGGLRAFASGGDYVADARLGRIRAIETPYEMPAYATREAWSARRAYLREHLAVCAGIWADEPHRPVEPVIFDRVERDGYSMEKVFFESRPGLYVTGNLYRPLGKSGPFPAVSVAHGHWGDGRLHSDELGSMGGNCIGLARRGFVAFTYDMMGYNDADQYDHRFGDERKALWGVSAWGLQTRNSIRVIDFLSGLPDVDPTRIAVTGESGGGTQTYNVAALDDRVAAAAPVNMVSSTFQGGCICENGPNMRVETFNCEIAAMMAPRPQLLVSCTQDWTKDTPRVEGPMVRGVYELLGAAPHFGWVQEDAPHNYNKASRQHVWRFLLRELQGEADPPAQVEAPFHLEPNDARLVFAHREPPPRMGIEELTESTISANESRLDSLYPEPGRDEKAFRKLYAPAFAHSVLAHAPASDDVAARELGKATASGIRVTRLVIGRKTVGDAIPALLFRPAERAPAGGVVCVSDLGKQAFLADSGAAPGELVRRLVSFGKAVLAIDPFLVGEAIPPTGKPVRETGFYTTYNRTDAAQRVQDVVTATAYLGTVAGSDMACVGEGEGGLWCLLARPLLHGPVKCAASFARLSVAREADHEFLSKCHIPLLRQAGDLRTAIALAAPAPLLLWDCGGTGIEDWAHRAYAACGEPGAVTVLDARPGADGLVGWLLS